MYRTDSIPPTTAPDRAGYRADYSGDLRGCGMHTIFASLPGKRRIKQRARLSGQALHTLQSAMACRCAAQASAGPLGDAGGRPALGRLTLPQRGERSPPKITTRCGAGHAAQCAQWVRTERLDVDNVAVGAGSSNLARVDRQSCSPQPARAWRCVVRLGANAIVYGPAMRCDQPLGSQRALRMFPTATAVRATASGKCVEAQQISNNF